MRCRLPTKPYNHIATENGTHMPYWVSQLQQRSIQYSQAAHLKSKYIAGVPKTSAERPLSIIQVLLQSSAAAPPTTDRPLSIQVLNSVISCGPSLMCCFSHQLRPLPHVLLQSSAAAPPSWTPRSKLSSLNGQSSPSPQAPPMPSSSNGRHDHPGWFRSTRLLRISVTGFIDSVLFCQHMILAYN